MILTAGSEQAAAGALGQLSDPRAVEPLIQALRDPGGGVREAAAGALGQLGDVAVEPLIQALRDAGYRVRGRQLAPWNNWAISGPSSPHPGPA